MSSGEWFSPQHDALVVGRMETKGELRPIGGLSDDAPAHRRAPPERFTEADPAPRRKAKGNFTPPPKTAAEHRLEARAAKYLAEHSEKRPWFQVDPRRNGARLGWWYVLLSLGLLFTALVTPYEVALLEPALDGLFYANRAVDLIFLVDILLNLVLVVDEPSSELSRLGRTWITSPSRIALRYLRFWFVVDAVAVGVSAVDIYAVTVGIEGSTWSASGWGSRIAMQRIRVLRVLRALRLMKLARLVRTSTVADQISTNLHLNYGLIKILNSVVGVVVFSHWMACAWVLQAFVVADTPLGQSAATRADTRALPYPSLDLAALPEGEPPSWLGENGYCWASAANSSSAAGYECLPHPAVYSAALYWAVMTITTIGYGDISATPGNIREMAIATAIMLLGAMIWGRVIGDFYTVIALRDPETSAFYSTLDKLNRFMVRRAAPPRTRLERGPTSYHTSHRFSFRRTRSTLALAPPGSLA